jgi:hypothetical protein
MMHPGFAVGILSDGVVERFAARFAIAPGCWEWAGQIDRRGYGRFKHERSALAHRVAYVVFKGPIPDGHHIDHLCRNRRCVNPSHLEAVAPSVNISRANASRPRVTHCKRGHELTAENVYQYGKSRHCKTCKRETQRGIRAARKAAA